MGAAAISAADDDVVAVGGLPGPQAVELDLAHLLGRVVVLLAAQRGGRPEPHRHRAAAAGGDDDGRGDQHLYRQTASSSSRPALLRPGPGRPRRVGPVAQILGARHGLRADGAAVLVARARQFRQRIARHEVGARPVQTVALAHAGAVGLAVALAGDVHVDGDHPVSLALDARRPAVPAVRKVPQPLVEGRHAVGLDVAPAHCIKIAAFWGLCAVVRTDVRAITKIVVARCDAVRAVGAGGDARLFDGDAVYSLAASLSQLLFDGGQVRGENTTARAAWLEQVATYRGVLLTALSEVDQSLGSINALEQQDQFFREALAQARRSFEIAEVRYREGDIELTSVLDAQTSLNNARRNMLDQRYNELLARVTLYWVLGQGLAGFPEAP